MFVSAGGLLLCARESALTVLLARKTVPHQPAGDAEPQAHGINRDPAVRRLPPVCLQHLLDRQRHAVGHASPELRRQRRHITPHHRRLVLVRVDVLAEEDMRVRVLLVEPANETEIAAGCVLDLGDQGRREHNSRAGEQVRNAEWEVADPVLWRRISLTRERKPGIITKRWPSAISLWAPTRERKPARGRVRIVWPNPTFGMWESERSYKTMDAAYQRAARPSATRYKGGSLMAFGNICPKIGEIGATSVGILS